MKTPVFRIAAGIVLSLAAVGASAQEIRYQAEISQADRVNSRGVPLKTLRDFLRQDRYNVNGGHHRDPGDTPDSRFATVEARGLIDGARLVTAPGLEGKVLSGQITRLEVTVSGSDRSLLLRVAEFSPGGTPPEPPPAMPATKGTPGDSLPPAPAEKVHFRVTWLTTLGPSDWMDSNGKALDRLREVLKQDRANVNRFGKADAGDERDPLFLSAAERSRFDTALLSIDPVLLDPLSRREAVKVLVRMTQEGKLLVTRPEPDPGVLLEDEASLFEAKRWKVDGLVSSGDPGAEKGLRELIALSVLLHGRAHESSVLAKVLLAKWLIEGGRGEGAKGLLEEIEEDFRSAASHEVDPATIPAVMGFLVEAQRVLGNPGAADSILRELLDPPGSETWKLNEEGRARLESLRKEGAATSPHAGEARPSYEEVLAAMVEAENDPRTTGIRRLELLSAAVSLHPRRRGADYEKLVEQLGKRVAETDSSSVDESTYLSYADAVMILAYEDFRAGRLESAEVRCEEVLKLLDAPGREEQMPSLSARLLQVRLATARGNAGEAEGIARRHFEWAKGLFVPHDGRLQDLASTYFELLADRGGVSEAEAVATPLAEACLGNVDLPDPELRLFWHELMAMTAFDSGDEARTDAWYGRIFAAMKEDATLQAAFASCYSRWGHLYEGAGQYGRAEEIWNAAAESLSGKPEATGDYVSLLQDLSLIRKHYRDEQGAVAIIEKSRNLARERLGSDSREYAVACNNLVLSLNALGRSDEAMRMADEALRVAAIHPDRSWGEENSIIFRNNRAVLLMNSDPAAAGAVYAELVAEMEAKGRHEDQDLAFYYTNLGMALRETGRDDEAEEALLRAVDILRGQGWENQRNLSLLLDTLGILAMRKGRVAEAVERARESARLAENFLQNASLFASETEKLALGSLFSGGSQLHILVEAGKVEEACELSLRRKGSVLDQSIREARTLLNRGADPRRDKLVEELRGRQRQLNRLTLALQQAGSSDEEGALTKLRQEVKRLQVRLLEGNGSSPDSTADPTPDLAAVRKRLGKDGRFYELVLATDLEHSDYYGAFEITGESVRWIRLASGEAVRIALAGFRDSVDAYLKARSEADLGESSVRLEEASRRLHGIVCEPLQIPVPSPGRIVICPEAALHFVPFAALLDDEGKFEGEYRIFDEVGSARDFCRREGEGKRDLLSAVVVGAPDYLHSDAGKTGDDKSGGALNRDLVNLTGIARSGGVSLSPLPGSGREADLVAGTLESAGARVTLLTADRATEEALAGARAPAIVHVATHGVFFHQDGASPGGSSDPMLRGALALSGAQNSIDAWSRSRFPDTAHDGWLFAAEAARLDLQGTELVTLSACETGIGDLASGEGVIGLRRAFVAAGARHVLSTLWPISDEMTVELMLDFYERLGQGQDATVAFASAQGEALKVFREQDARGEAIALFGAFVMNRAGTGQGLP
ncbi:MAG: CHAT domain-containing protein [Verrucomicrobiae bacterium]|nr:CHAT domain-containing protein [Verrucomicrobiae bacterium]